ncbi:MAG: biopolymer transporter ExbD [Pyrinomonadaceae bacterium]|nr:biopolymer transporter ExbD [Pyrinomonadaceae bacterium]
MNKPNINVTPLIDVLLVLLIIFMVVSPLKPGSFKTTIPSEPTKITDALDHPDTLIVTVNPDSTLSLNQREAGTTNESAALVTLLKDTFNARIANGNVSESFGDDPNRPTSDRIERTVFIKAPKTISYGSVARVVDAAKLAGAYPISLQIDRLD